MVNTCILSLRKQKAEDKHSLIAVDLHNLPYNDWQALEANFYATATHIPDVQTNTYARYSYLQGLISTYWNLSFFIGSPSLYKLLSDNYIKIAIEGLIGVFQSLFGKDKWSYQLKGNSLTLGSGDDTIQLERLK